MLRVFIFSALLLLCSVATVGGQQAPDNTSEVKKSYDTYDDLFEDFQAKREVLLTKMDRLRERENVKPEELKGVEDEMKALDEKYGDALEAYIVGHPDAKDLMPARFELTVTFSRIDGKLEKSITVADEFIKSHSDSELIGDVYFIKAQTLFRLPGRESDALKALDTFIKEYPDRQDADPARMMRIRTLLFLNRVADARQSLGVLVKSDRVKEDKQAEEYLQTQLDNIDWVGRDLPAFTAPDLKGEVHKAENFSGKPTLIFVWDSNSSACLGELSFIQEAYRQFSEKMNFLSVSVNESKPALEQWLDKNPEAVKFPTVWFDRDAENTLVKKLDVSLIPFLVLVDASGKIYRYDVRSDDMLRYASKLTGE
ncbi:MAG: thioredoxin-like domain-containing protein [Planctomycetota bacterium]